MFSLRQAYRSQVLSRVVVPTIWAQKTKCEWHTLGDNNTKYFHSPVNRRWKRKKVEAIQIQNGDWIYDVDIIKDLALVFFKTLFTDEGEHVVRINCDFSYPPISAVHFQNPGRSFSGKERKQAVFGMRAIKSLGPNGFNALFFQTQWQHVGNCVSIAQAGVLKPRID